MFELIFGQAAQNSWDSGFSLMVVAAMGMISAIGVALIQKPARDRKAHQTTEEIEKLRLQLVTVTTKQLTCESENLRFRTQIANLNAHVEWLLEVVRSNGKLTHE